MTILQPTRSALRPWPVVVLRVGVVLLLAGQLYVTGAIERRDLLNPSHLGFDASNYYAAGQRLNVGHSLYGPLQPDDRLVPGYPAIYPAPLLSPPLIAVAWRPLALLPGTLSMDLWWLGGLALLTALTVAFAAVGKPRNLIVLVAVLVLGLPLTLVAAARYPYLGFNSPVSLAALSGNVNAYLVTLFALAWWGSSRHRPWLAGSAAALAAVLKLGPVVLLWWFVTQRSWRSARAFIVAAAALGVAGVVFAGLQANLDFVHLAFGGDVRPTELSVPGMLQRLLRVPPGTAGYGTVVVFIVGLAAIQALRNHPRAAFAATILTAIYSSPVVLPGNFALLVAVAAPWVPQRPTGPSEPATRMRGRVYEPTNAQPVPKGSALHRAPARPDAETSARRVIQESPSFGVSFSRLHALDMAIWSSSRGSRLCSWHPRTGARALGQRRSALSASRTSSIGTVASTIVEIGCSHPGTVREGGPGVGVISGKLNGLIVGKNMPHLHPRITPRQVDDPDPGRCRGSAGAGSATPDHDLIG